MQQALIEHLAATTADLKHTSNAPISSIEHLSFVNNIASIALTIALRIEQVGKVEKEIFGAACG